MTFMISEISFLSFVCFSNISLGVRNFKHFLGRLVLDVAAGDKSGGLHPLLGRGVPGKDIHDGGERKEERQHGRGAGTTQEVCEPAGRTGTPESVALQRAREYGGKDTGGNSDRPEPGADQGSKAPFFLVVVAAGGTEPCVFLKRRLVLGGKPSVYGGGDAVAELSAIQWRAFIVRAPLPRVYCS